MPEKYSRACLHSVYCEYNMQETMEGQTKYSPFLGEGIIYPESDGKPMADNTIQAEWIINLYNNFHILFSKTERIFIAADHFWYPVEGSPNIRKAPDVMVVLDRPRGHRRSYRQWDEEGVAPHVVFEINSPSNTDDEMLAKRDFYEKYGVEEFVIIYPEKESFTVYQRKDDKLDEVRIKGNKWQSPSLGMQLLNTSKGVKALYPDGTPFKTAEELNSEGQYYREEAERLTFEAEQQKLAIEQERKSKEEALAEIERLKEELKRMKGE